MNNKYKFELNMNNSYKKYIDIDEWGTAVIDFGTYGAEYNFCIEEGNNYSAIYYMEYNEETGYWDTDYNCCFEHYEINFNDFNWKKDLEKAMYNFIIDKLNKRN